jgi:hypothetical protein
MTFVPTDYTVEKLGSLITGYSTKYTWIFQLDKSTQLVSLEVSYLSGYRKICLNNKELQIPP